MTLQADAVVVGAGYYGCTIALRLRSLGLRKVLLLEAGDAIMRRASFANQARVHNGYHYPRSLQTGRASRESYARFVHDHRYAVFPGMRKIYAIGRGSRVTGGQFERFCMEIDARLTPLPRGLAWMFDSSLVTDAYLAEEIAFDATAIARKLIAELEASGVELRTASPARVEQINATSASLRAGPDLIESPIVINCTYASLDRIGIPIASKIRREVAEMAMVSLPPEFEGLGITLMDGPFFSVMPFPSEKCHTVSHVRYTPVAAWVGDGPPQETVPSGFGASTNAQAMVRDAARFVPLLRKANITRSIYETKAVLASQEKDDGRPILLEKHSDTPLVVSILGGKIDNIYDALDYVSSLLN